MREITNEEIQKIELDILAFIKKICDENNLRYYLAYGSLIGAIRHKGFIPWDDDVDIMMPRKDYLKLIDLIKKENQTRFKLVSVDTDPNFTAPLAKVIDTRTKLVQHYGLIEKVELGVYIDIFLLDGVSNDYDQALKYYDEAYYLYTVWQRADTKMFVPSQKKISSFVYWLKNLRFKVRGYQYWLKKLELHNKRFDFDKSKYVSVLEAGTPGADRNVWPKSYFENTIDVPFEGIMFKAPKNYDEILRREYGDYMKLPPKEKRISHHYSDIFWKNK